MRKLKARQHGSAVFTVFLLLILAYGVYLGIQYVPLKVESSSMDSILESLEVTQKGDPVWDPAAAGDKVSNALYVNQMTDMRKHFDISQRGSKVIVRVKYERDLNLLFFTTRIVYDKSVTLR